MFHIFIYMVYLHINIYYKVSRIVYCSPEHFTWLKVINNFNVAIIINTYYLVLSFDKALQNISMKSFGDGGLRKKTQEII